MKARICVLMLIVMGIPSQGDAWGRPHSRITEEALGALPRWEQEIWQAERDGLIREYCMYPDLHRDVPERKKELDPYCLLPNQKPCPHQAAGRSDDRYVMRYYLGRIVEALRAKRITESARFGGTLAHYIEDSGCPVHVIDNSLILKVLPPPEAWQNIAIHGAVEGPEFEFSIAGYRPVLLGQTIDEAVCHLYERYQHMIRIARAQIAPVVQGIYADDKPRADAARAAAATACAQVLADAWHTAFAISQGRFAEEELEGLSTRSLVDLTPIAAACGSPYGTPMRNGSLGPGRRTVPIVLLVADEAGKQVEKAWANGIGVGPSARIEYDIGSLGYTTLTATVGLHAGLGRKGAVEVTISGDGKELWKGSLKGGEPARPVEVPIAGVRRLVLSVDDIDRVPAEDHTVFAGPMLGK